MSEGDISEGACMCFRLICKVNKSWIDVMRKITTSLWRLRSNFHGLHVLTQLSALA